MCLSSQVLNNLCELFPNTAKSLKYRALDRRNFFLKAMQAQEIAYGVDRDKKTGLKKFDNDVTTLGDEIMFEDVVKDYSRVRILKSEVETTHTKARKSETVK